jgi:uncharacterized protein (TIGR02145 family)
MSTEYDPVQDRLLEKFFLLVLGLALIGGLVYGVANSNLFGTQAATTISTTATSSFSSLEDGLVGHWTFDGDTISGTTVTDVSGNGNNGTLTNGPTPVAGKIGQGIQFDGSNDYVRVSSLDTTNFPVNGTLSFWIKTETMISDDKSVFHSYDGTKDHIFIRFCSTGNGVCSGASSGNRQLQVAFQKSNGTYQYVTNNNFSENEWTHVVAIWDTTNDLGRVYHNGVQVHSGAIGDSSWVPDDEIVTFGAVRFPGILDDTRIYNRVLSAEEVWRLYKMGEGVKINSKESQGDPLTKGLVGYWKLDDASGTNATDSSGNGNTGTLTNGPTWTTGMVDGAANFDGTNDYVSVGNQSVYDITGAITISAWVKMDSFKSGGSSLSDPIVGKWAYSVGNQRGYDLRFFNGNTLPMFVVTDGVDYDSIQSTISVSTGVWKHIVGVWYPGGSNNLQIYVNGKVTQKTNSYASLGVSPNALHIGHNFVNAAYLDGSIDEVRVYNRALSADEVARLYRTTDPNDPESSLVGHWTFDGPDIEGTTAYDLSSKGNHGTLTGGVAKGIGQLGQGITLDGSDDYVTIADNAALDFGTTADFTLSGWFRRETYTTDDTLIAKRNGIANTDDGYIAYIDDSDDKFYFEVSDNADTDEYSIVSTRTFTDNEWHNFIITWDDDSATNINLYIDGSYETTVKTGTLANIGDLSTALAFRIGAESDNGNPFAGKLDDIKVYNRAFTHAEAYRTYSKAITQGRTCGTVTDSDGNLYGTLKIGTQCWMAQNMRVGTRVNAATNQTNNGTIEKWCYSDSDANCTTNHSNEPDGGLYQWNEAMQYSTTPGAQGICPTGFHIPTDAEQYTLENHLKNAGQTCNASRNGGYDCSPAGTKLKTGGTSGFDAGLAGIVTGGAFGGRDASGYLLSSSLATADNAWRRRLTSASSMIDRNSYDKSYGLSVRCLRD